MKKGIYLLVMVIAAGLRSAYAQNSVFDAGVRLQKTINLYSENGIGVSYSYKNLLADRLYFGASYATSRLGTAFNSNAIKQDNFLVSTGWYFRRDHVIRPFVRANGGYFSAYYGEKIFDVLPRNSPLLSSELGISFQTGSPVKIATSLGYNFITGNGLSGPGTLYPVFYLLTVSWNIFDHSKVSLDRKLKL